MFSSEETTLLDVWVDSSLVCDSDHLAVVGTYQTVRNVGVFGTSKKKRIPCALRWTASDPVAWEKAVGGSGEFGADWRDPLAFLGFLARTADLHKTRQKCEKDQVICDLKAQLQCASTAVERRRYNRLLWRRRRALARQRRVVFLREACEAKRSPVRVRKPRSVVQRSRRNNHRGNEDVELRHARQKRALHPPLSPSVPAGTNTDPSNYASTRQKEQWTSDRIVKRRESNVDDRREEHRRRV